LAQQSPETRLELFRAAKEQSKARDVAALYCFPLCSVSACAKDQCQVLLFVPAGGGQRQGIHFVLAWNSDFDIDLIG
jgi:hypothetical protein